MTEKHILEALEYLEHEKTVVVRNNKNNAVPDRIITHYALTDPRPYPIRETITVGEVEFPGMIHGDLAGAEDLNIFSESLAEYDSKMEGRITDLAAAMTRRYWTNIAILFALFVAVFAFILRATDPIVIEGSEDAAKLALTSTARLLPLAGILFGFVLSMWWLVRRL